MWTNTNIKPAKNNTEKVVQQKLFNISVLNYAGPQAHILSKFEWPKEVCSQKDWHFHSQSEQYASHSVFIKCIFYSVDP